MVNLGRAQDFCSSYGSSWRFHTQNYDINGSWKILLAKTNWLFDPKIQLFGQNIIHNFRSTFHSKYLDVPFLRVILNFYKNSAYIVHGRRPFKFARCAIVLFFKLNGNPFLRITCNWRWTVNQVPARWTRRAGQNPRLLWIISGDLNKPERSWSSAHILIVHPRNTRVQHDSAIEIIIICLIKLAKLYNNACSDWCLNPSEPAWNARVIGKLPRTCCTWHFLHDICTILALVHHKLSIIIQYYFEN